MAAATISCIYLKDKIQVYVFTMNHVENVKAFIIDIQDM